MSEAKADEAVVEQVVEQVMDLPREVLLLTKVMARQESRYAIHGIHLIRNGTECRAEATDGRRLVVIRWKELSARGDLDLVAPGRIFADALGCSREIFRPRGPSVRFVRTGSEVSICILEKGKVVAKFPGEPCDAPYPKFDKVIPDYSAEQAATFAMNPTFLREVAEIVEAFAVDKQSSVLRIPHESGKPLRMDRNSGDCKVTAVLMSCKMPE